MSGKKRETIESLNSCSNERNKLGNLDCCSYFNFNVLAHLWRYVTINSNSNVCCTKPEVCVFVVKALSAKSESLWQISWDCFTRRERRMVKPLSQAELGVLIVLEKCCVISALWKEIWFSLDSVGCNGRKKRNNKIGDFVILINSEDYSIIFWIKGKLIWLWINLLQLLYFEAFLR